MNEPALVREISALQNCTCMISENLRSILAELPEMAPPEGLRDEIVSVCEGFECALWDVGDGIHELEETQQMDLKEGGARGTNPQATLGLIGCWMRGQIDSMRQLVIKLDQLPSEVLGVACLQDLVRGSVTNILHWYNDLRDRLERVSAMMA